MKNHKSLIPLIWLLCIAYGSFIPFHIRTVSFADALNQFRHIPFLDLGAGSRADWVANILLYNGHVLTDTTKHETLAKFEKWS